jgi:preprotein translocase subunit SecB
MINLSTFKFDGYKILKSNMEFSEDFKMDTDKIHIAITVSGLVKSAENKFILNLNLKLKDDDEKFQLQVESLGNFSFKPAEDGKDSTNFFYINASAILFPYVRGYISLLTSISSNQTLNLPTMNLTHLGKELKENLIVE